MLAALAVTVLFVAFLLLFVPFMILVFLAIGRFFLRSLFLFIYGFSTAIVPNDVCFKRMSEIQ